MKRLMILMFALSLLGLGGCFEDREQGAGDGKPFQTKKKNDETAPATDTTRIDNMRTQPAMGHDTM